MFNMITKYEKQRKYLLAMTMNTHLMPIACVTNPPAIGPSAGPGNGVDETDGVWAVRWGTYRAMAQC